MQNFAGNFVLEYILQIGNVCVNCTGVTNQRKSNGALNNPWRGQTSIKVLIKWDLKNDVKVYGMYIAVEEDDHWELKKSQRKRWNMTKVQSVKC